MNARIVKRKTSDTPDQLYEVQYVVHPAQHAPASTVDVYACYRLSAYDGMPIGSLIWLRADELVDADAMRVATLNLERK